MFLLAGSAENSSRSCSGALPFPVFVAHYTPLKVRLLYIFLSPAFGGVICNCVAASKERKEALLEEIRKAGLEGVRFIEKWDREVLSEPIIEQHYSHFRYLAEEADGDESLPYTQYKMSDKEISVAMKQLEALQIIVREGHQMALILEDDGM